MSTMGLLNRPRAAAPTVYPDVNAALWWDRKGLAARLLADAVNQRRAAYAREQHRLWKQLGWDKMTAPQQAPAHMRMVSTWMGNR